MNPKLKSAIGVLTLGLFGGLLGYFFHYFGLVLCVVFGGIVGIKYGDTLFGPWFPKIK